MGDSMYWQGQQPSATWQHPPPAGQPVEQYESHPSCLPPSQGAPPMPADPSFQMQSRHQSHQQPPPNAQSTYYSMMPAPNGQAHPPAQHTPSPHLTPLPTPNQSVPSHPAAAQQPPQPNYQTQYSSYWSPPPMNQPQPMGGPHSAGGLAPQQQMADTNSYHTNSVSPLAMPADNRASVPTTPTVAMQQPGVQQPFQSSDDVQSNHMMSYDRQRSSMPQQHPSPMMPHNGSTNNISPSHNQMNMQAGPPQQAQMNPMAQQTGWTNNYYASNQSPYPGEMNPYSMPYGNSAPVPNHGPPVPHQRPAMVQKPYANGNDMHNPSYAQHPNMYGQPPPQQQPHQHQQPPPQSAGYTNGYYSYDPYYNQGPPPLDPYQQHPNSMGAPQHYSSSASSSQMLSNNSIVPMQHHQHQPPLQQPPNAQQWPPQNNEMPIIDRNSKTGEKKPVKPRAPKKQPNPNAPTGRRKRPVMTEEHKQSGYAKFYQKEKKKLKGTDFGQSSKIISESWARLSDAERATYVKDVSTKRKEMLKKKASQQAQNLLAHGLTQEQEIIKQE